jgi:hypothetical protein
LIFVLVDPDYNDEGQFHDSARSILVEWLNHFAEKSEDDLNAVLKLLDDSYHDLKLKYSSAKGLMGHAERIVENFRDSDKTTKKIDQIKPILDSL